MYKGKLLFKATKYHHNNGCKVLGIHYAPTFEQLAIWELVTNKKTNVMAGFTAGEQNDSKSWTYKCPEFYNLPVDVSFIS